MRNGQNGIVGLMDNSGATVVEYTYDSWGKSLTVSGTLATTLGANNPFRYRGYYYDTETGLYYLQSRYYDATVCKFISADEYLSTGQGIGGNNVYVYCLNNPAIRIDIVGETSVMLLASDSGGSGSKAGPKSSPKANPTPNPSTQYGLGHKQRLSDFYGWSDDEVLRAAKDKNNPLHEKAKTEAKYRGLRNKDKQRGQPVKSVNPNKVRGLFYVAIFGVILIGLVADDFTGVGAADDGLLPSVVAGFFRGLALVRGG